jgi:hypothetical protein
MGESMMWRWVRYLSEFFFLHIFHQSGRIITTHWAPLVSGTLVSRLLPRPKDFVGWDVVDEITSEQAAMGPFGWIHGWKVKLGE